MLLVLLLATGPAAQAQQGRNGARTVTALNTVVNEYTALTADVVAGAANLTVANSTLNLNSAVTNLTAPLAAGDLVLVIQMQGAAIDQTNTAAYGNVTSYNSAGRYELAQVAAVPTATTITLTCGLTTGYSVAGMVQVIRVPRYSTLALNVNTSLTASAWDGTTGGVLVVDVQTTTTLASGATLDVSGKGFRGGAKLNTAGYAGVVNNLLYVSASNTNAEKGEGIAGSQATYDGIGGRYGRGAAANGGGGGNSHNAAGGGGANAGVGPWTGTGNPNRGTYVSGTGSSQVFSYDAAWNLESANFASSASSGGGRGGYSYSANNLNPATNAPNTTAWGGDYRQNNGGLGGRPLNAITGRLFLGGGGGAGNANDGGGSGGATGGGLIILNAGGALTVSDATNQAIADGAGAAPTTATDAAGGGGGGGSIFLNVAGGISTLGLSAKGGAGGNFSINWDEAEGPGGGGGGGAVAYTTGTPVLALAGGANGTCASVPMTTAFPPNGSTIGGAGTSSTFSFVTAQCITADVTTTLSGPATAPAGSYVYYTATTTNTSPAGGNAALADVTRVVLSASLVNVSLSNGGVFNTATNTATWPARTLNPGDVFHPIIGFLMPASGSVTGTANSSSTTTDPLLANNNGTNANARVTTTATQVADVSATVTGPPAAVPNTIITYSVLFTNYGPSTALGVTAQLQLPANLSNVVAANGTYVPGSGLVTFVVPNAGTLASGSSLAYIVRYTAPASGSVTGTVSSTATTANGDPNAVNNNGTAVASQVTTVMVTTTPSLQCNVPGASGSLVTTAATIVNTYYPGAASAAAGQRVVVVGTAIPAGAPALATNDLVMLMQMQGADLNSANTPTYGSGYATSNGTGYLSSGLTAGQYEYGVVASVSGTTITLASDLINGYQNADATADGAGNTSAGQRRFQLVRVPQYQNLTLGADLTTTPVWNGRAGGVLVLDIAGQLDFGTNYAIDVSARGFRGGAGRQLNGQAGFANTDQRTTSAATLNASKGEGIAGTPRYLNSNGSLLDTKSTGLLPPALTDGYPFGDNGQGAPGNGGGGGTDNDANQNDHNTGGGGGANVGTGGLGGNGWDSNLPTGGKGGAPFTQAAPSHLVMGGGGGAGTNNNGTDSNNALANGFASSGAAGGGIALIRASTVAGTGSINASGAGVSYVPANDGSGGGGAGGSVLLLANNSLSGITVLAGGGSGGTNTGGGSPHGPGGGGSGGLAFTSSATNGASAFSPGVSGTTFGTLTYGATAGTTSTPPFRNDVQLTETPLLEAAANCVADVTTTINGPGTIPANGPSGAFVATFANNGLGTASTLIRLVTLPTGATVTAAQQAIISSTYPGTTFGTGTISFPSLPAVLVGGVSTVNFRFTGPPTAGVNSITSITNSPTQGTNQGSDFAPNSATLAITVEPSATISGTIFDDVNYGGGSGRPFVAANTSATGSGFANIAIGSAGTTVELYDNTGSLYGTTTTGVGGTYSIAGNPTGTYTVRVVNSSVKSVRNPASLAVPVQTFRVNGGADDLASVGGENPVNQDAAANTGSQSLTDLTMGTRTPESIGVVTVASMPVPVTGVDFGYNFDVIVNTNDIGQGSLRQFITNANMLGSEANLAQSGSRINTAGTTVALPVGQETSIFMIPFSGLSGNVAMISVATTLPIITGANAANTVIDGTTQTFNIGDLQAGTVGATTTTGADGLVVTAVPQPEIEISGVNLSTVLDVEATNTTVRGLAIHGGNTNNDQTVLVGNSASATGFVFENMLIGVTATGAILSSSTASVGFGLNLLGQSGTGIVQNNYVAFTGNSGIRINNGTGTTASSSFLGNQFMQIGYASGGGDGLTFGDGIGSGPALVQGNLFTNMSSSGLQFEIGLTSATQVLNNTILGAGSGSSALEKGGIVYLLRNTTRRGSQLDVLSKNIITGSQAAGIVIGYGQQNVTISQNQLNGNGGLGIDLIANSAYYVGSGFGYGNGDGVTVNDGSNPATAPATLPNRGVDFPVFTSAVISGTNLVINGYARPGAKIELYTTGITPDPTGFGEGQTYLGTVTEGGAGGINLAADTDPRAGLSYTNPVNGRNQGLDASANGFTFTIPLSALPGGVLPSGTVLSSTATLSNSTSEFSGDIGLNADVTTTITGPTVLAAGQPSGAFVVAFSNVGTAPATAIMQAVTLPAGATLAPAQLMSIQAAYPTATITYSGGSGGTLTFAPASTTLVAGASNVYQFAFTSPTATGAVSIVSNVRTGSVQRPNTAPDMATFSSTVTAVADVAAIITGSTAVQAGTSGTFSVSFANLAVTGPQTAAGVVATVQLLAGLNTGLSTGMVSATNGGVYDNMTGLVSYSGITSITSGQALASVITYTQPGQGGVAATASISTTTNQAGQIANDAQTAAHPGMAGFDLATTLNGPATATAGTQVTYAVTTTNNGPGTAPNAVQTVSLSTTTALTNVFLSNGGMYTHSSGIGTFTFPTIPFLSSGQQVNNSISFTSPGPAAGSLVLTAQVLPNTVATGDYNSGGAMSNNQATFATNLTTAPAASGSLANLYITIVSNAPSGGVAANALVTFTVKQGNNGPTAATSVVTLVYLPTGLAGVLVNDKNGAALSSTYNPATGVVTFPTETSEASACTPLSYTITASAPATGVLTATASVSAATNDPVPADNVAVTEVTMNQPLSGDIATTLTGPLVATPGENIVYTVGTINNGTTAVTGIIQTVQLPAGLVGVVLRDEVNNVVVGGYNSTTGLVTFGTTANLGAGLSLVRAIVLPTPDNAGSATGGSIGLVAAVSSTSVDNVLTNNAADMTTTIQPVSDFAVSLSGSATTVVGNPVTFTVAIVNNGPSIGGQQTTVQLPIGLDAAGGGLVLPTGAIYTGTTGMLTMPVTVAQGLGIANALTYAVTFKAPVGKVLFMPTAQATPATGTNDANLVNNVATVATTVTPATELVIDLATTVISNAPGNSGGAGGTQTANLPIVYTVTSTNNTSGSTATNAVQQLTLAAGLTGVQLDGHAPTSTTNGVSTYPAGTSHPAGATYNANTGVITFPAVTLVFGASASATVQVNAPGAGPLVATAAVKGDQTDPASPNNTASTSVSITPSADLVTSTTGPATTQPGTPVNYSVVTINNGPSAALAVVPTIILPSGATNVVLPAGAALAGSTVTFATVGSLASGQSATNTVRFTAPAAAGSFVVNGNSNTTTAEPSTTNNPSSTTTVNAVPVAPPVAFDVVNKTVYNLAAGTINSATGNTAAQSFIVPLSAAAASGQSLVSYTITPVPTVQGTLYYNTGTSGAPNYVAVTASVTITPAQATSLRFDPAATGLQATIDPTTLYSGNSFFQFTATDNLGNVSNTARYTIPVSTDNKSVYTATPNKGGSNQYQTDDVLAYVIDPNGAQYNSASPTGLVYNTAGTRATILATGGTSGLVNQPNTVVQSPSGQGPAVSGLYPANPTNVLPLGVSLDTQTGLIYVSDRSLLTRNTSLQYYQINVITTDVYGGTNLVPAQFTIGAYPLPVELTDFTAQAVKNVDAVLAWRTALEKSNDHFDVERSLNGTDFVKIGQVRGQGSSTTPTAYALTDAGIGTKASGTVYYRLRQVDTDGTATYSPIRTVAFSKVLSPTIALFPNPATVGTQLDLTQLPAGSYQVSVLDATGRVVLGTTLNAGLAYALDLNTIASGTYTVLVRGQNGSQVINLTKRLIKE